MPLQNDTIVLEIVLPAAKNKKAKNAWKKPKNKTNLQQYISLQITLPQIVPSQNDTEALKIMFPAANKWLSQKCQKKKLKTKAYLQQCISLHITLPQIMPAQSDTKAIKIMFQAAQND